MSKETFKPVPYTGDIPGVPMSVFSFSEETPLQERRNEVLRKAGILGRRKKYPSAEARKAAAKKRRKERQEARKSILERYGLAPGQKKLSPEERKQKRRSSARRKREQFAEMVRMHPESARGLGIKVEKYLPK